MQFHQYRIVGDKHVRDLIGLVGQYVRDNAIEKRGVYPAGVLHTTDEYKIEIQVDKNDDVVVKIKSGD